MIPPTTIPVPEGTIAIYLTAISLFGKASTASVSWTDGSATFGADFVGPSSSYVLTEKVFGLPIVSANPIPSELKVSFNFNDNMTHQHSVSEPVTKIVGPAGDATSVQISGYDSGDHKKHTPTTVTILFQGKMRGIPSSGPSS